MTGPVRPEWRPASPDDFALQFEGNVLTQSPDDFANEFETNDRNAMRLAIRGAKVPAIRPDAARPGPYGAKKQYGLGGRVADVGVSLLKGAIAVPEAAVGLGDIVSGGRVGQWAERAGFDPGGAKRELDELYSPEQQEANANLASANGFRGKLGAALSNPSTILQTVAESAPGMLAGGAVGRVAGKLAGISGIVGGAVGEGAIQAGSAAEQTRQQDPSGRLSLKQAGLAASSGVITGALGVLGGKVAKHFGFTDVDALLAGAAQNPVAAGSAAKRIILAAVEEGVLEELPQSVQEQMHQNAMEGKPIWDGLDNAAVMGLLSGAMMGAGSQVAQSFTDMPQATQVPVLPPAKPWKPRTKEEINAQQILMQGKTAGRPPAPPAAPPAAPAAPSSVTAPVTEPVTESVTAPVTESVTAPPMSELDAVKAELATEREKRNSAERDASMHPLTGLPNAAAFGRARASADADPNIAIASFDANGFKAVNDALGHDQGDEMMKHIAQMMQTAAKAVPGVRVFHKGGDEFALIGPTEGVAQVRDEVEKQFGLIEPVAGVKVSLSGGIGNTFADADADLRMRKAQHKLEQQIPERGMAPAEPPAQVRAIVAEQAVNTNTDPTTGERLGAKALSDLEKERVTASTEAMSTPPAPTVAPAVTHGAVEMPEGTTMPEGIAIDPESNYAGDENPAALFAGAAHELDALVEQYKQMRDLQDDNVAGALTPKQKKKLETAIAATFRDINAKAGEMDDAFHPDQVSALVEEVLTKHGMKYTDLYPSETAAELAEIAANVVARDARNAEYDAREAKKEKEKVAKERKDAVTPAPRLKVQELLDTVRYRMEHTDVVPPLSWRDAFEGAIEDDAARDDYFSTKDADDALAILEAQHAPGAADPDQLSTEQPVAGADDWFAGSKVVDAEGNPLVVYHGTRKKFAALEVGTAVGWGRGIYFTDNEDQATNEYGHGGRVIRAHVSIKNPYRGQGLGAERMENTQAWRDVAMDWRRVEDAWEEGGTFVSEVLQELGYDGVMTEDSNDVHGLEIVAFTKEQVRPLADVPVPKPVTPQIAEGAGGGTGYVLPSFASTAGQRGAPVDAAIAAIPTRAQIEQAYDAALKAEIAKNPGDYAYGTDETSRVATKMVKALAEGTAVIQGSKALKKVSRKLGIVNTRAGWKEALAAIPAAPAEDDMIAEPAEDAPSEIAAQLAQPSDDWRDELDMSDEGIEALTQDMYDVGITDHEGEEPPVDAEADPVSDVRTTTRTSVLEDAGTAGSQADIEELVAFFANVRPAKTPAKLRAQAEQALGRAHASGTWQMDDVYDAIEGAVNKEVSDIFPAISTVPGDVPVLSMLDRIYALEQDRFSGRPSTAAVVANQQYSTPLPLAYGAQLALRARANAVILEPTAGTGGMVTSLGGFDRTVRVNELDQRRRWVLEAIGYTPTSSDALNLPIEGVRVNDVVMNPPYGNIRKGQYHGFGAAPFNATDIAQRFVAQQLTLLPDGGRLVALLPSSTIGTTGRAFRDWLDQMHTPLAYVASYEEAYISRGARLNTVMLVVDKGQRPGPTVPALKATPATFDQWARVMQTLAEDERFARWGSPAAAVDVKAITAATPAAAKATPKPKGLTPNNPIEDRLWRMTPAQLQAEIDHTDSNLDAGFSTDEETKFAKRYMALATQRFKELKALDSKRADAPASDRPAAPAAVQGAVSDGAPPVADGPGGEPGGDRPGVGGGRPAGESGLAAGTVAGRSGLAAPGVVASAAPDDVRPAVAETAPDVAALDLSGRSRAAGRVAPQRSAERDAAALSAVFVPVVLDDATERAPHPRLVVETRSMAGMPSPKLNTKIQSAIVEAARDRPGKEGGISDQQIDAVRRATTAWKNGHGILIADDVGVGKAREAGAIILEAIAQGATRILYTTFNGNNVTDAIDEFRALASGSKDGAFPAQIIRVSDHKDAGFKRNRVGELPMPTDGPALYIVDAANFANYADALMQVRLDAWVGDEAHKWKNPEAARGMAWAAVHKEMLDRNMRRFAYLTATPAVSLDEIGYLYGLKEWAPGSFGRWLDIITGKATAAQLSEAAAEAAAAAGAEGAAVGDTDVQGSGKKKKPNPRAGSRDVYAQTITPAESEQVMRELKGKGKYMARDLWRGGVDFAIAPVDLVGDTDEARGLRTRLDEVASLVREIQRAARQFGYLNKKVTTTGLERSMLQGYVKQLTFDLKLDTVLRDADAALDADGQVVISVNSVTGDDVNEEGSVNEALGETFIQGNKRLLAATNRINSRHVVKEGTGDEAEYVDLGEIPEALLIIEGLKERIAKLPPLRDPVKTIETHFGAKNVAVIVGSRDGRPIKAATRAIAMAEFQAGDRRVALISTAGKTGISLHDVNGHRRHMLIADYEWSADTFKQELGRVDRTGQVSSPFVRLYASNLAPEARFSSNIAALMSSLGAVSKGSAESTGTDALDQFDLGDGFARLALNELWFEMPQEHKALATGKNFVDRQRLADGTYEYIPKRNLETGIQVRHFFLELMGFPVDVAHATYARWMEIRDRMRAGDEEGTAQSRRTQTQSGTVLRRTELVKDKGKGPIALVEIEYEGTTDKGGIVQGFVTQHIDALQTARGRAENGLPRPRRYVRFTDVETGELVAGLEVSHSEARRVKALFEGGKVTAPTKAEALAALTLGEDVPLVGDKRYSKDGTGRWVLHPRKLSDGRVRYEIRGLPFTAARDAMKNANGAKLKAETGSSPYIFMEQDDVDSHDRFLTVFPPAAPTPPKPAAGGGSFGGATYSVFDPFTAAALMARSLRQAKARRDRNAEPLVTATRDEVEERLRTAESGRVAPSIIEKARAAIAAIGASGRHFEHVDPKAGDREAATHGVLLEGERSAKYGQARAYNLLWQVTDGLTRGDVRTMTRHLALTDVLKDVQAGLYEGKGLPFGFADRAELEDEIDKLEKAIDLAPKVYAAEGKRARLVRAVTEAAVEADLLHENVLADPRYFHRQVLEYMALADDTPFVRTGQRDSRVGSRGYQKGRTGGGDFNLRYQEAEFEWLSQALRQLHTKGMLTKLDNLWNEHGALRTEARAQNKRAWQEEVLGPLTRKLERAGWTRAQMAPALAKADPDRPFRMRIARAAAEMNQMIATGAIQLPMSLERAALNIADAIALGTTPDTPEWFQVVAHLAAQTGPGAVQARMILKATNARELAIKTALGSAYVNPRNPEALLRLAPEGYVTWQPVKGNFFYNATALAERVVDEVLAGEGRVVNRDDVREVLALGGPRETWIIPDWLAVTLDGFGKERSNTMPEKVIRKFVGIWKGWTLNAPHRTIKYNVNNAFGDADAAMLYPGIFKESKRAAGDIYRHVVKRTQNPALIHEMEELLRLGVMDNTMTVAEIPDVSKLPAFEKLVENNPVGVMALTMGYFSGIRTLTTIRENILRVAAYRWALKELQGGRKGLYGAAPKHEMNALKTHEEKAALFARSLLGDYQAMSTFGTWARDRIIPFFSWWEINFKRYSNLIRNIRAEGSDPTRVAAGLGLKVGVALVARTAKTAVLANAFLLAIALWNRLRYPEDEEIMRAQGLTGRLLLGRDHTGAIRSVRAEGAFADFLNWLKLGDYPGLIADLAEGKTTVAEMARDAAKAPVNRVVNAWEPFTKTSAETIFGKSAFPDVFNPRTIREKQLPLFRMWGVENLYKRVTGRPVPETAFTPGGLLFYKTDAGEAAYFISKEIVSDWNRGRGRDRNAPAPSARDNALYYYKYASKVHDPDAAEKWLRRYYEMGGTRENALKALKLTTAPLSGIPLSERLRFRNSLVPREKALVEQAEAWWRETYKAGPSPVPKAALGVPLHSIRP